MPISFSRDTFLHFTDTWYLLLLSFIIIIFPLGKNVYSNEITLTWDHSNEEEDRIVSYRVYYREEGQNYNYSNPAWKGTEKFCTITNLDDNKIYYFVSRSFNIYGFESNDSNEMRYPPLNLPPIADNPLAECTIYEDAEDGTIKRWDICKDTWPPMAKMANVYDEERQSRVFESQGAGTKSGYCLYLEDGNKWNNNSSGFENIMVKWSMRYSEDFFVYFEVESDAKVINMVYLLLDTFVKHLQENWNSEWDLKLLQRLIDEKPSYCLRGVSVYHFLDPGTIDGEWHTFVRDLQADLEDIKPLGKILKVNGFEIYGSGRVDDIMLCNTLSTDTNDTPANSLPIAENQSIITSEDTPIAITLNATDPELDPLTYTVVTQPIHGTLSGTAPNLSYSPNVNYSGPDIFTFKASDGKGDSNIANVDITIEPANDPPTANEQVFITSEDVAINKTLIASDVDGDGLIFTILTNGNKGNAIITNPSNGAFTYTPDKDIHGTDTFSFKVNDGTTDSEITTVTINIIPINDAPMAQSQSLSSDENASVSIILTGSDVDGDILTYTLVTQPSHGALSGTAPTLVYIPNINYVGSDNFSFKVNDGVTYSYTATISITLYPVEDPLVECMVYEDAEDSSIDGWSVFDEDPSGALISNVFDTDRENWTIELTSTSRDYCYLLRDGSGSKWKNPSQFVAKWSMQYSKYFIVYFDVHTTAGDKYVYYTPVDFDKLGDGYYVHHGLGSKVTDGQWYNFERNLQADLEEAQPGVSILEVNGFMIYGSGRVDDIMLCNTI